MDSLITICLCALGIAAIVVGAVLKRRAASLRMHSLRAPQPAQRTLPDNPVRQPSGIDVHLRDAWRKCGDAHRAVKQVPECERAQQHYKLAIQSLRMLSKQLQDPDSTFSAIVSTAALVERYADDAMREVVQFHRQAVQR